MKKLIVVILALISFSGTQSEELDRKLNIPEKIRKELNEDMHLIQSLMNQILDSMSRAQWQVIYDNAKNMETDFILKQKMDKKSKELLMKTLPKDYIQSDKQFHYWASVLAAGAKKKNGAMITRAYAGLVNTCITCHAEHAPYLFKDFKDYTPPKKEDPKAIYKHPDDWR